MDTQNFLLYSAQNQSEMYLLKMNPSTDSKGMATGTRVLPLDVLGNTYTESSHLQHSTPFFHNRQSDGTELSHELGSCNDTANLLPAQQDMCLQNEMNTPLHTSFMNTFEISSDKSIQRSELGLGILKQKRDDKSDSTNNRNQRRYDYMSVPDRVVPPRAVAVLPAALRIRRAVVTPRRILPPRVRFGPIQGIKQSISSLKTNSLISNAAANNKPILLLKGSDNCFTHIDVSDKDKSNWMCLLPLGNQNTANVWIYEDDGELYGITTEFIPPRESLSLGYSKSYAQNYSLPVGQPVLDLDEVSTARNNWWCFVCRKAMATDVLLQQHIDTHNKDDMAASRRRYYHCRHCKRKFCRRYTLKRHLMSRFCLKNATLPQDDKYSQEPPDVGINITQSTDDNRIPSDESFQNYSNGLDFSTNLFDDRMPSLDISGNSRGENDFIPYTIDREENIAADLGFTNGLECSQNATLEAHKPDNSMQRQEYSEPPPVSLQTCVKPTPKKKKKQESMQTQRFECKCGRVYNSKEKLTKHIYTVCSADHTLKPVTDSPCQTKYKCDKCLLIFKRRGMLVNHLWRVHKATSTSVPLEKRIRHYPCVVCPKIYRTAAKRNHHVTIHHPEAQLFHASSIDSGVVTSAPAACSACPRQYCTRAKLLQHVRAAHPHLAPVVNKSLKSKLNETIRSPSIVGTKQLIDGFTYFDNGT